MSRIAKTGTVKVYKPFHIEPYRTVFQMTSMITATLRKDTDLNQVLSALFLVVQLQAPQNSIR